MAPAGRRHPNLIVGGEGPPDVDHGLVGTELPGRGVGDRAAAVERGEVEGDEEPQRRTDCGCGYDEERGGDGALGDEPAVRD